MGSLKSSKNPSAGQSKQAAKQNERGLAHYGQWEMEEAIAAFHKATSGEPDNPEYHLNLARAYARSGAFDDAMGSLGEYLRTETDENVATRYERLFSSAMDDVETMLVEKMPALRLTLPEIGKAIQMWLEYRITVGRRPLRIPKPELWAAAVTHAVAKINMADLTRPQIAQAYGISERSLQQKYEQLDETLDLMPADFRYFCGEENPLDKVVEAAQLLEEMYGRFREE